MLSLLFLSLLLLLLHFLIHDHHDLFLLLLLFFAESQLLVAVDWSFLVCLGYELISVLVSEAGRVYPLLVITHGVYLALAAIGFMCFDFLGSRVSHNLVLLLGGKRGAGPVRVRYRVAHRLHRSLHDFGLEYL